MLTTPSPVVRPPQHVLDLTSAFGASMARQRGTLVTFEDNSFSSEFTPTLSFGKIVTPTLKL